MSDYRGDICYPLFRPSFPDGPYYLPNMTGSEKAAAQEENIKSFPFAVKPNKALVWALRVKKWHVTAEYSSYTKYEDEYGTFETWEDGSIDEDLENSVEIGWEDSTPTDERTQLSNIINNDVVGANGFFTIGEGAGSYRTKSVIYSEDGDIVSEDSSTTNLPASLNIMMVVDGGLHAGISAPCAWIPDSEDAKLVRPAIGFSFKSLNSWGLDNTSMSDGTFDSLTLSIGFKPNLDYYSTHTATATFEITPVEWWDFGGKWDSSDGTIIADEWV